MNVRWPRPPEIHPQASALVRRAAPDLIIGLLGIPLAFAFQEVSQSIICATQPISTERLLQECPRLIIALLYFVGIYWVISCALLDIIQHPWNWGSKGEKWLRFLVLSLSIVWIALLGVYGKDMRYTEYFTLLTFLCLSVTLQPDIRNIRVFKRKQLTSPAYVALCILTLLWNWLLVPRS